MPYLSDKMRVELTLPAQMMLGIFIKGTEDEAKKTEEYQKIAGLLVEAGSEAVIDLAGTKKARQLLERASRVHIRLLKEFDGGNETRVDKMGLIFFHMIRHIIESGYLQYVEGSAIDQSINHFMEALQPVASVDKVNNSAMKQAKKGLRLLQLEGYYQGIDLDNLN